MEFNENIVLGGSRKEYCENGPATGILCWIYILGDLYLTRLSGLMGSEADSHAGDPCSFPRREDSQFSYCEASLKKQGGRYRRTNLAFWVAESFLSASRWVSVAWSKVLYGQLKFHLILMCVWWKNMGEDCWINLCTCLEN